MPLAIWRLRLDSGGLEAVYTLAANPFSKSCNSKIVRFDSANYVYGRFETVPLTH